jgi:hypothetical protein
MVKLLPAYKLLTYPLTFLNLGGSMLLLQQEESHIDVDKYCRLGTVLNAEAIAIGEVLQCWPGFT